MTKMIEFIDLKAQQNRLGDRLSTAIDRVLDHGRYIMGPEVAAFEDKLAEFCGARNVISCANGTEALTMVMMAWGIGPGDAVFVPSFNFIAAAESVALLGATPVFVDVHRETFNIDPASLEGAIGVARDRGLTPRVIVPVDLFGQPADYPAILGIAEDHDLLVLSDAAQSFGGRLGNRRVGTFGHTTTTSFFPAKPLGCYGDGGAVFTEDDDLADTIRSIRVHGKGSDKYDNVRVGLNARLDTLQAAILIEKLAIFADELEARQVVADRYTAALSDIAATPHVIDGARSAWAQYTLIVDERDALMAACKAQGVPTQIYYPTPLHQQSAYADMPQAPGGCPVSAELCAKVVSLPMHPYLSETDQDRVIGAVRGALGG